MKYRIRRLISVLLGLCLITSFLMSSVAAKYVTIDRSNNLFLELKSRFHADYFAGEGDIIYPSASDIETEESEWEYATTKQAGKILEPGDEFGEFPVVKRTGYDLLGWARGENGYEGAYLLPQGFTQLEYIQSNGKQNIKLPYPFDETDSVELICGVEDLGADKFVLCASHWDTNSRFAMGGGYSAFGVGFGGASTTDTLFYPSHSKDSEKHTWTYENRICSITDLGLSYDCKNISWGGTTTNLVLFYGYSNNTKGRVYFFQQKKNGELVLKLVPAIWNGGIVKCSVNGSISEQELEPDTVGLYDLVNNVFYLNSGSGNFSYGQEIYSYIKSTDTLSIPEDWTLHAQWSPMVFKLFLSLNDSIGSTRASGELGSGIIYATYDKKYSRLPEVQRNGYEAVGWMDDEGTVHNNGDDVKITADTTFSAVWVPLDYTVSLNPNGGSLDTTEITVTFDQPYGELGEPIKNGSTFTGWKYDTDSISYNFVEAIVCNGKQYIQLPYGFDKEDEIELVCKLGTFGNDKYIVAPSTWNNNSNRFAIGGTYSGWYTVGFGSASTSGTNLTPKTTPNDGIYTWTYKNRIFELKELSLKCDAVSIGFGTETAPLRLFYGYNGNTAGTIYSFKQIRNGEILLDLVPMVWTGTIEIEYYKDGSVTTGILAKGTVGMYDKAHDIFYIATGENPQYEGDVFEVPDDYVTEETTVTLYQNHSLIAEWE